MAEIWGKGEVVISPVPRGGGGASKVSLMGVEKTDVEKCGEQLNDEGEDGENEKEAAGFESIRINTLFTSHVDHSVANHLAEAAAAMITIIIDGLGPDGMIKTDGHSRGVYDFLTKILTEVVEFFEVGVHKTEDGGEVCSPLANSIRGWMELEAWRVRWAFEGAVRLCVGGDRMVDMHWTLRNPPTEDLVSWLE